MATPVFNAAEYRSGISCEFFFALARSCQDLLNTSEPLIGRVAKSVDASALTPQFQALCVKQAKASMAGQPTEEALKQIFTTVVTSLLKVLSDDLLPISQEMTGHWEGLPLQYRNRESPNSSWHNYRVRSARDAGLTYLKGYFHERYPQWDVKHIELGLKTVPPASKFRPEYSETEVLIRSRLPVQWVSAFLVAQYIAFFGVDLTSSYIASVETITRPIPEELLGLLTGMNKAPRCHSEFFNVIKLQPPFVSSYGRALEDLMGHGWSAPDIESAFINLTHKFSLYYSWEFMNTPEMYESLTNTFQSGASTMLWALEHMFELQEFANPDGLSKGALSNIGMCIPIVARVTELAAIGTERLNRHTALDYSRNRPDEEFDD